LNPYKEAKVGSQKDLNVPSCNSFTVHELRIINVLLAKNASKIILPNSRVIDVDSFGAFSFGKKCDYQAIRKKKFLIFGDNSCRYSTLAFLGIHDIAIHVRVMILQYMYVAGLLQKKGAWVQTTDAINDYEIAQSLR